MNLYKKLSKPFLIIFTVITCVVPVKAMVQTRTTYDLGEVAQEYVKLYEVEYINEGNENVTLKKITSSCSCSLPSAVEGQKIPANSKFKFKLQILPPANKVGEFSLDIMLTLVNANGKIRYKPIRFKMRVFDSVNIKFAEKQKRTLDLEINKDTRLDFNLQKKLQVPYTRSIAGSNQHLAQILKKKKGYTLLFKRQVYVGTGVLRLKVSCLKFDKIINLNYKIKNVGFDSTGVHLGYNYLNKNTLFDIPFDPSITVISVKLNEIDRENYNLEYKIQNHQVIKCIIRAKIKGRMDTSINVSYKQEGIIKSFFLPITAIFE